MQKFNRGKQQQGFFDLGLSVLILALTGAIALSVNQAPDEKMAQQQDQNRIVESQLSTSSEIAVAETARQ